METKRLRDILKNLETTSNQLVKHTQTTINEACRKLIELLYKLGEEKDLLLFKYPELAEDWIFLDNMHPYLSGRYCGEFFNLIIINNVYTMPIDQIRLTYRPVEGIDYNDENYKDDGYNGDSGTKRKSVRIQEDDIENFAQLLDTLVPYFRGSKVENEFECLRNLERKTIDKLDELISTQVDEQKDFYFKNVFKKADGYDSKRKKHFLKLPYGLSIRYMGKFCNCLTLDNFDVSLGYLKEVYADVTEEEYTNDIYTVYRDDTRTIDEKYVLVHEYSLQASRHNWREVIHAYSSLIAICETELENGKLEYIKSDNVRYHHTILTD